MLGTYITFPELLIWIPFITGIICFFLKDSAKGAALTGAVLTLAVSIATLFLTDPLYNNVNYVWLKHLGNSYYIGIDGTARILTLLNAVAFPLILAVSSRNVKNSSSFFGLMMLSQAGMMGVFTAMDALLFYFFWELALIPVYFLSSKWGGERRIQATFKFFIYTFAGSLLMLVGLLYVYQHTPGRLFEDGTRAAHSFALQSFQAADLSAADQSWLFWLFFAAFAIKMPVFPFHTWQPDTYDQSPTTVTMVLSAVMVKMGLFGVIRWLMPVLPEGVEKYADIAILLSVIGILYASLIAMVQDNLKRLVAYSSIAHIGLMAASLFSLDEIGVQGMMIQMFNHGINILGLWVVVDIIEKRTGTKKISELGGLAVKAPSLTIMLVVIALANIALPLTNAFIGEFMMFGGLFRYNTWFAAAAIISIILAAAYTLNMIRKVFYGPVSVASDKATDLVWNEKFVLALIVIIILVLGIYPQPLFDISGNAVNVIAGS